MRNRKRRGWLAAIATLLIASAGCRQMVGAPSVDPVLPTSLVGQELEYRFAIGRLYRATYSSDTVEFQLLEPERADPPHATLPYVSRLIRPGVFLVAWGGAPEFHATFVIDFARRELHATSARQDGILFFETARIELYAEAKIKASSH